MSDESAANGIGAVDADRLARSIATIADLYELPSEPATDEVFDDAYLPPIADRSF